MYVLSDDKVTRFRHHAEEARTMANLMRDKKTRKIMLSIAKDYDDWADDIEINRALYGAF